jgi:hypothetical protein
MLAAISGVVISSSLYRGNFFLQLLEGVHQAAIASKWPLQALIIQIEDINSS